MSDLETIEAEVVEVMETLPAVQEQHAVNLFGDASPVSVIERATEAANALAAVIEAKQLYALIGQKKHVVVEGWTLLGSMLGVFPVVEWTRQTEDGWEARVVARTRNGDEVGAAEAMCSRKENRWKSADDYAIRSMAQTRAVSKALRHPLGFVMTLAGYEATPEAEMPTGGAEKRTEGPEPLAKPTSWAKVTEMVSAYDEDTYKVFLRFAEAARRRIFPGSVDTASLEADEKKELLAVVGEAALVLRSTVDSTKFPAPTEKDMVRAWASVLEGEELAAAPEAEG
jgi:hypothetical protein